MKLFTTLSAAALVRAQFNDFANLNDLFASLQNDLINTTDAGRTTDTADTAETTTENNIADVGLFLLNLSRKFLFSS